jgi:hypothetical protein
VFILVALVFSPIILVASQNSLAEDMAEDIIDDITEDMIEDMIDDHNVINSGYDDFQIFNNDIYINSDDTISFINQTVVLNCNLVVNSSGVLNIHNSTIMLNSTQTTNYVILIRTSAVVQILDSFIIGNSNQTKSLIIFDTSSIGVISNSKLGIFGINYAKNNVDNEINAAFLIRSDKVLAEEVAISNFEYGAYIDQSSPKLTNIHIENCNYGIYGLKTAADLKNISTELVDFGLKLSNNSNITLLDCDMGIPELDESSMVLDERTVSIRSFIRIVGTQSLKPLSGVDVLVENSDSIIYRSTGFGGGANLSDSEGFIEPVKICVKLFTGNEVINYSIYITARFGTRSNYTCELDYENASNQLIILDNNQPFLNEPMVTPWSGDTETIFSYKIKYSDLDNDSPEKVMVEIDGETYNMSLDRWGNLQYEPGK